MAMSRGYGYVSPTVPQSPSAQSLANQYRNATLPVDTSPYSTEDLYKQGLSQMQGYYGQFQDLQRQLNALYDPHLGRGYIDQLIAMMNADPSGMQNQALAYATAPRESQTFYGVGYV